MIFEHWKLGKQVLLREHTCPPMSSSNLPTNVLKVYEKVIAYMFINNTKVVVFKIKRE